jgi:hypothetical protein
MKSFPVTKGESSGAIAGVASKSGADSKFFLARYQIVR